DRTAVVRDYGGRQCHFPPADLEHEAAGGNDLHPAAGRARGRGGMSASPRRRKIVSRIAELLCAFAILLALLPLALILFYVVKEGVGPMNLAFFTKMLKPVGEPGGGMGNAIVGTLILIGLASLFAVPIGCICGIYLSEYPGTTFGSVVRFAADVLNGVPSIVVGIFAYGLVVLPVKRFSAVAGGVALGMLMIPIVVRTTEELLRLVPAGL